MCAFATLADAGAIAKGSAGTAADVLPQASLSKSRTERASHPGDSSGHSRHSRSSGDRGQEYGGESDRADDAKLAGRHCGFRREDRGGGGGASGFFHFLLAPGSGSGHGSAAVGGIWLAARALRQRTGSADLQRHCPGDREKREKEMGAFPSGLSQISSPKLPRMGGSLHRAVGVGTKLLPATTASRPRTPSGSTSSGVHMDSHPVSLLERSRCL